MKNVIFSVILSCTTASAYAQNYSAEDLAQRTIERRAVETVNWGMAAVNYDLMLQEMLTKTAGKVNQIIYWGRPRLCADQGKKRNGSCRTQRS
jgi:hypothetical protein